MPILHWLDREKDVKAAENVPYRLLEAVPDLSYGDPAAENMLIQGDNLEALKALLPYYARQVKCIFIDPPYNTRKDFGHYDDNLEHTRWLARYASISYGGSASGGGNGEGDITIMYTPDAGFTGQDTFEYVIYDNMGGTDTGLITISVGGTAPPNSTPIASDDGAVTQEDTAVVIDVLANDTDADGDVLSVTQLGAALNGSVVLYGGDGNDYLDVSSGNNILYGGNGDDKLIAGSGVDTFVFRQGGYRSGYDLLHECEWWGPSGYI